MLKRSVITAAATSVLAGALALAAATPAAAEVPHNSSGCAGGACIKVDTTDEGGVLVTPSTDGLSIYGHWQYLTPREKVDSGPNEQLPVQGSMRVFFDGQGQYCVILWGYNRSTGVYTNLGEPCETVHW